MRGRLILGLPLVAGAVALFAFAGQGAADPSDLYVPQVPPHRHFIQTATGDRIPVGPQVCEHPELMPAFEQFHFNVHHSFIPPSTTVHTLGPQDGAPGLHNGQGAELVATLC